MTPTPALRRSPPTALLWVLLAGIAAALWIHRIGTALPDGGAAPAVHHLQDVILLQGVLPRMAMALAAGAALGLSGVILQRVLRNPLAEPSTLGISAGGQLALAATAVFLPDLAGAGRGVIAFAGGLAAIGLVLGVTWRRGLEPVAVALAGMMLGLTATAASAALILANGEYLFSVFLWGGGSLVQQGWQPTLTVSLVLVLAVAAVAVLFRPLAVLGLGDDGARGLGVALTLTRLTAVLVAVALAAAVTAEVGIIGFVGLAAPALARLAGARTQRAQLVAAPLVGALLLWLTDGLVQLLAGPVGARIPTGAATALLGGPLLLWLLPRLRLFEWPTAAARPLPAVRAARPALLLWALVLLAGAGVAVALAFGRSPGGWSLATGDLFADLLAWRGPRVTVAAAAGAMLGAAGALLQRVTANPLAGPEVLGVGVGSGVGLAVALYLLPAPGLGAQSLAAAAGAVGALALLLTLTRRGGLGPERLLLAGLALGAFGSSILTAVIATGSPEGLALVRWLSGANNEATVAEALFAAAAAVALVAAIPPLAHVLQVLPLGATAATSLGLRVERWRAAAIVLAGLLSAVASLFVGPLSFIGLIAPHLARLLGLPRVVPHLAGSVLIGALLMVASDWLARTLAFPYQLPLGLFAALLGGAYLVWLLGRSQPRTG